MHTRGFLFAMSTLLFTACSAKTLEVGAGGPVPQSTSSGTTTGGGGSGKGDAPPTIDSTIIARDQRNIEGLVVDRLSLYWVAFDASTQVGEVRRCPKNDCPGHTAAVVSLDARPRNLHVLGEELYFLIPGQIASSSVWGSLTPTTRVDTMSSPEFAAFDTSKVYWTETRLPYIYACPVEGCDSTFAEHVAPVVDAFALDDTYLYWVKSDAARTTMEFAPKDGSAPPMTFATGTGNFSVPVTYGGFVYWAIQQAVGTIQRCPAAGCDGGNPEILVREQFGPSQVVVEGDTMFWTSQVPTGDLTIPLQPRQISSCRLDDCAGTVKIIAQVYRSPGGPFDVAYAVDDEAVYWVGDVMPLTTAGTGTVDFDGSIRRRPRR